MIEETIIKILLMRNPKWRIAAMLKYLNRNGIAIKRGRGNSPPAFVFDRLSGKSCPYSPRIVGIVIFIGGKLKRLYEANTSPYFLTCEQWI